MSSAAPGRCADGATSLGSERGPGGGRAATGRVKGRARCGGAGAGERSSGDAPGAQAHRRRRSSARAEVGPEEEGARGGRGIK